VKPKLAATLERLRDAEVELAGEYREIGERHAAEHDVFHICHTLASQCAARAEQIGRVCGGHGERNGTGGPGSAVHSLAAAVRRKASEITGRSPATGELLLRDLRHLYVLTGDCQLQWMIVAQGAKAARETELIDLSLKSCEEVSGQMRWIITKVKLAAPQAVSVQ